MNLCPEPSSLAFRIVDGAIEWEPEPLRISADEALMVQNPEDRTARGEAKGWLRDLLADGRVASTEVLRLARREGIAKRTLHRAKSELGVKSECEGFGNEKVWYWKLPADDDCQ
jgi:hypothetical protein